VGRSIDRFGFGGEGCLKESEVGLEWEEDAAGVEDAMRGLPGDVLDRQQD
jgi:hypothetical protein